MKRNAPEPVPHPASFRDPSGFVVRAGNICYRQVDQAGAEDYERLMRSGLYERLAARKLLIPHTEIDDNLTGSTKQYKTLLPRQVPFISYPSEWSPDQLRDIALLTLDVLELALDHGMTLKDASPMNVQFDGGSPVFIDTLSFTSYDPSRPWVAYRQFCECCLFPLYIHRYTGAGVHRLFAAYPEGIPAGLTARLLPIKSRLSAGVWMHVLLQSKIRSDGAAGGKSLAFSKEKLLRLIHHLRHIIKKMDLAGRAATSWSGYYGEGGSVSGKGGSVSGEAYLKAKEKLFLEFSEGIASATWLDLGANDGRFTRLIAGKAGRIVAVDSDWLCIDRLYLATRNGGEAGSQAGGHVSGQAGSEAGGQVPNILPLCVDLCDPTAASGFLNEERTAFIDRARSEAVVALALVHHLALGRSIPLAGIAGYFAELTKTWLIAEFVPLTDERALALVRNKALWHTPYDRAAFESAFGSHFLIERCEVIPGTERVLYRMKKKNA
jgi:hypothetical protein